MTEKELELINQLRALWTSQNVPQEQQDELVASITRSKPSAVPEKLKFTVIGITAETSEVYYDMVEANDAFEAMRETAQTAGDDDSIVAAIYGHHRIITPGIDNMQTAAASDLREGGDDD